MWRIFVRSFRKDSDSDLSLLVLLELRGGLLYVVVRWRTLPCSGTLFFFFFFVRRVRTSRTSFDSRLVFVTFLGTSVCPEWDSCFFVVVGGDSLNFWPRDSHWCRRSCCLGRVGDYCWLPDGLLRHTRKVDSNWVFTDSTTLIVSRWNFLDIEYTIYQITFSTCCT